MTTKLWPVILAVGLTAGVGVGQGVIDSVDVGCTWVGSLAYNSRANVLYGASCLGRVFTIDCATNQLHSWIGVRQPLHVCYDSMDNKAYVTYWDSVLVMSGESHTRIGSIPMPDASELVWDARTNRLYVSGYEEDVIGVIDCRTDSLLCLIPVPGSPLGLDPNTRRPKLYARCVDAQNVAVIDLTTNQVARMIPTGGNLSASCYAGSVDKYYCDGDHGVFVVGGMSDSVIRRIPIVWAMDMTCDDRGSKLAVSTQGIVGDSVFVIDAVVDTLFGGTGVSRDPAPLMWAIPESKT
jgi:DNA-binding beta-propeller fold protein YncE